MTKGYSGDKLREKFENNLVGELTPMNEITGRIVDYKTRRGPAQGIDANDSKSDEDKPEIEYLSSVVEDMLDEFDDQDTNVTNGQNGINNTKGVVKSINKSGDNVDNFAELEDMKIDE